MRDSYYSSYHSPDGRLGQMLSKGDTCKFLFTLFELPDGPMKEHECPRGLI